MAQTITLTQSAYNELLARITKLEKTVISLISSPKEPKYGTDAWFEWAHKEGMKAIEKGDYYELRTDKELKDFFDNIESDRSNKKYDHYFRQKSRKAFA
jgi:hypothetical protein